jgi:hypothetical protein
MDGKTHSDERGDQSHRYHCQSAKNESKEALHRESCFSMKFKVLKTLRFLGLILAR